MGEAAVNGRIQSEHMVIEGTISLQKEGLRWGAGVTALIVCLGFVLILLGKDGVGFASIVLAVASLLGAFLYGKISDAKVSKGSTESEDGSDEG
ncbi:MAG TPA: hypothetical protein VHC20_05800 [Candidatus Paceibacterota bacterium]|nr:hypothetical protein [Candidatus Paceibacterota bacterium]